MIPSVLQYLPDHRVILCMLCEKHYCIPPNGIRDHLFEFHKNKLTKKERRELVQFASSLDLAQPRDVKIPKRENGALSLLHKEEGYECLTCHYVCPMDTTMDKHGRGEHQWSMKQLDKWKRQWVQVFTAR